jgi:kinesin family member C1
MMVSDPVIAARCCYELCSSRSPHLATMAASRLPRPGHRGSSPDATAAPALTVSSLKRKASDEDDDDEMQDRPQKLPAIATRNGHRPLQPNRTANNLTSLRSGTQITRQNSKPTPPVIGSTKPRGTSAPPTQPAGTSRAPGKPSLAASKRGIAAGRSVSGSGRSVSGQQPNDLASMHSRISTLETSREADSARVAAQLQAERDTIQALHDNQNNLARELAESKQEEMQQTTRLRNVSDELSQLQLAHAKQVMELELSVMQKDSAHRQVSERARIAEEDLDRERQVTSTLKATISQQSTAQITVMAEKQALQAQLDAVQSQLSSTIRERDDFSKNLEDALAREAHMKEDLIAGEMTRRKLHNMVQELKGNIRVFCRVRPILSSDLPSSSSITELSDEEFEKRKEGLQGNYLFPDRKEHKEIVLNSASESATGQQRNETYTFGFDRVCVTLNRTISS